MKRRTYGYDAVKMADNMTYDQLMALDAELRANPANQNPKGSFWLYTKACRRKLDAISWAVYHKQSNVTK